MKDYYKILDIQVTATKDEIKNAFRTLAKKYHPDKNKDNEDTLRKFQDINEAYQVLSDEDSRKEYDKKLSSFNQNNNKKTSNNDNKSKNDKRTYRDKSDSIENLNKCFESFFGFDANTSDIDKDKLNQKKNPIDTSNMFDSFFSIKKK
ncbi:J domain-containing protein [Clostridium aciditolerans]|uniref:J domain-containing protein n=1 Tax=Clostridium aciditolerans TaxID=339861 RepID=A0A934HNE0_9CLOT|nr:DnaJ domain-containing protein [Clostridium aciditolerans]MBI6871325.1 J domain-containing protein [Clostridium aciditolerans]